MNKIDFMPMESCHVDGVFHISEISFHLPWSITSIRNELNNGLARYIVAVDNGKVVGYGGAWFIVDEGHITNIAVLPEYRKQHIGSGILKNLIEECKNECIVAMTLEVRSSNISAQSLYKKFDFVGEGIRKRYYADNGEDAIIMWKRNL